VAARGNLGEPEICADMIDHPVEHCGECDGCILCAHPPTGRAELCCRWPTRGLRWRVAHQRVQALLRCLPCRRNPLPFWLRSLIYPRQNYKCAYLGRQAHGASVLVIEWIPPPAIARLQALDRASAAIGRADTLRDPAVPSGAFSSGVRPRPLPRPRYAHSGKGLDVDHAVLRAFLTRAGHASMQSGRVLMPPSYCNSSPHPP
jgi:hypothetical protein